MKKLLYIGLPMVAAILILVTAIVTWKVSDKGARNDQLNQALSTAFLSRYGALYPDAQALVIKKVPQLYVFTWQDADKVNHAAAIIGGMWVDLTNNTGKAQK